MLEMKENRLRIFGPVLAVLLALGGCTEDTSDRAAPLQKKVSVVVEPVDFTNEQTRVEAVGTSRAMQSVTLTPDVSGEVVAVNFEPGQYVEKDSILVQLDDRNE